jgi:hypothetical protein
VFPYGKILLYGKSHKKLEIILVSTEANILSIKKDKIALNN